MQIILLLHYWTFKWKLPWLSDDIIVLLIISYFTKMQHYDIKELWKK